MRSQLKTYSVKRSVVRALRCSTALRARARRRAVGHIPRHHVNRQPTRSPFPHTPPRCACSRTHVSPSLLFRLRSQPDPNPTHLVGLCARGLVVPQQRGGWAGYPARRGYPPLPLPVISRTAQQVHHAPTPPQRPAAAPPRRSLWHRLVCQYYSTCDTAGLLPQRTSRAVSPRLAPSFTATADALRHCIWSTAPPHHHHHHQLPIRRRRTRRT